MRQTAKPFALKVDQKIRTVKKVPKEIFPKTIAYNPVIDIQNEQQQIVNRENAKTTSNNKTLS